MATFYKIQGNDTITCVMHAVGILFIFKTCIELDLVGPHKQKRAKARQQGDLSGQILLVGLLVIAL